MPNTVHGITDVTGVSIGTSKTGKAVCVLAVANDGVSTTVNTPFQILSIADATTKFGTGSKGANIATILFKGGVSEVWGVAVTKAATDADKPTNYATAMDSLLKYPSLKIIVVDEVLATVLAKVKDHIDVAESQDIFRYGVVGQDSSDNTALTTEAAALNSKRMFISGPRVLDTDGQVMSGIYAAAGLAALMSVSTNDPALPLNGVTMVGFGGVDKVLLKTEMDALVNGGVVPLYNANGEPAIYRLVTTYTKDSQNTPDPTWKEGTTIFISDDVLESCETIIKSRYKRTKNVARILKAIRTDIIDVLQTKNDMEIIENFDPKTVSVVKDPNDAYGALIDYEYDVVTPLYTITIRQHMTL